MRCHQRPHAHITCRLQAGLLKWIVLVFHDVDNLDKLHSLYGVFFHYIDFETLVRRQIPGCS